MVRHLMAILGHEQNHSLVCDRRIVCGWVFLDIVSPS